MKINIKDRKILFFSILTIFILVLSFLIYRLASADTAANKIAMNYVKLTSIKTGSGDYDSTDGINYSDSAGYSVGEGYIAGNDSNENNRIVRSFDKLSYNFEYEIKSKTGSNDYEERTVSVQVTIPDELAKYVTFTKDGTPGETTHTYTFDGIDTYGSFKSTVTLYVLGAPNGTKINPKFEIQESTNTDLNYLINLGSITFDTEKYNYEYDSEKSNKYSNTSNVIGFLNYMPTIVSSKTANYNINLIAQSTEGQKSTYDNTLGRYLTYVFGLQISGDSKKGIKGLVMPDGSDITFNIEASQNGTIKTVSIGDGFVRLYGSNIVSTIEPISVALPYSTSTSDTNKLIKNPGTIKVSKSNDTTYNAILSGYKISYENASMNADGSKSSNNIYNIGTFAASIFSKRDAKDNKNDITTILSIPSFKIKNTDGTESNVTAVSASAVNKYYEIVDYSITGDFYNSTDEKISSDSVGTGAVSKGENIKYKTTFNYKKTNSNQGLKEIIKVDPDAYRVMQNGNSNIKIKVENNGDTKISQDDFDVTFVSGDFINSNYVSNTVDKLSSEESSTVTSSCATVTQNLSTYTKDQIMNLYGGPCINAKEGTEQTFKKIIEAKDGDNEIPISKIVVQTKEGVKLPDSAVVTVEVSLRVRNISDITKTYQATVVASSSDYDDVLTYYAPRITTDENSITNPNNYNKTVYKGSSVASKDTDSPWGDSLKIVNFTSREEVTVKNKNKDGSTKTNYTVTENETIIYNVKTTITDENENVGADDVWYINHLKVKVTIPNGLIYVEDKKLGTPEVQTDASGNTILTYTLPYTKPNMKIEEINFKTILSPKLSGSGVELTVTSEVEAININNEKDTSYFNYLKGSFSIYASGEKNVIATQKIGSEGSKVEKNSEFSYVLSLYNNVGADVKDYAILDILPNNGDNRNSDFNGTYKVKIELPGSLGSAKVYCSETVTANLNDEVMSKSDDYKECNVSSEYVSATAIKITGINISKDSYADDIVVRIKPENNNYSDKYINSFIGASETYSANESNDIEASVVSRNISGRVFIDNNENGIEDDGDTYYENMTLTLYKLDSDNNMTEISTTETNKDGKYSFKDLDVGRYKIRAVYDSGLYDLTLRYGTEDTTKDSDGYKVSDSMIEISNKKIPDASEGIRVTREIESISDMNIGLISRKSFGFDIKKYITKIDLTNNSVLSTYTYSNQNKVLLNIRNPIYASARVYYGIEITNNSTAAGYVKLLSENIPDGLTFNANDEFNKDWFYSDNTLQSIALENDLINPGESRHLTIVLDMPSSDAGRTYLNTVSILEIEKYEPEPIGEDVNASTNTYSIGEKVTYAGIDFHVINAVNSNDEQILTLLADSGTVPDKMGHTSSSDSIYKWSDSIINKYINGEFINTNSLNPSILIDNSVCDDASGLQAESYGGTLISEGKCVSNKYNIYKVRLLTETEFNNLKNSNLSDLSWLYGNSDFYLMNSVYITQEHDAYGRITDSTNVKNLAKYVSKESSAVKNGYDSNKNNWIYSNTKKEVRPVITISSKNIIPE